MALARILLVEDGPLSGTHRAILRVGFVVDREDDGLRASVRILKSSLMQLSSISVCRESTDSKCVGVFVRAIRRFWC